MYATWKGRWKIWARGGASRPPLLLLHGFTGDAESWRAVMAGIEPGRTVVTLTLPGHEPPSRRSALGVREPDFASIVDRLAGDLQHILPPPYHVVGYSMGARVAMGMLVRHPALFSRAMLIGGHPGLESEPERALRRAEDERWATLLHEQGVEGFADAWEEQALFATQEALSFQTRNAQRALRTSHTPEGLAWALRYLGLGAQPSYWDALLDLDLPVDLVVGAQDPKFDAITARMATRLPRARVFRIAGAGHNVVLEAPEAINDLLHERTPSCLAPNSPKRTGARTARSKNAAPSAGRRSSSRPAPSRTSATRKPKGLRK